MAKALVGHVQKRHELLALDGGNHLVPLVSSDVVTGGVMAAGVQQDDGAGGRSSQVSQHAVEVHTALGCIVVAVVFNRETGAGEQRAVVFPAGVGDQDFGVGVELFEKVGANFQAAGAANALHRGHAAAFDGLAVGAKYQAFDGCVVGGNTVDGQVATCRGFFHHGLFSGAYAVQQGQFAVVVEIHAHAEVDLGWVGVGVELFVETQDGVTRGHFDG